MSELRRMFLGLGFVAACTASASDGPKAAPAEAPSAAARWIEAEPASELASLDVPARVLVAPDASAVIGAPLGLRVLRVRVRPGQRVGKGDPVVDVSSPEVVRAAGALIAVDLRLAAHEQRRARLAPLVEQGLARTVELSELDAARVTARAERESARAVLRSAGLSDRAAPGLVEGDGTFSLRSPIAGMVTAVSAVAGAFVDERSPALVEVSAEGDAQVEARFSVVPPDAARFVWLGRGERVPLELVALAPGVRKEDGARLGWLQPREGGRALTAGALGRVRVEAAPDWVAIPSHAIKRGAGGAEVEVRDGQSARWKAVQVIMDSGSTAVVTGLEAGSFVRAATTSGSP
jgi:cobalt-zinc-cadmium efflux system membrane fusion protein